ncbi:Aste57867_16346 [Aphanomyces stellatus]|uniref:Aste57867_16346 protein n=1 Tax=Aphanomyces stellatus TaxID=120398 RepID=A0A485L6G5_9STRA|nr:hypothetical protein As57867_016289 [Aphanomyces stellatus]VFT93122.1 Aste57867_16346 [Aphanomyces stellatus]
MARRTSSAAVLTMNQLMHQDQWVPDKERERCNICSLRFGTFTRRKHHCRTCGEVVCSGCLMKRSAELPVKGIVDVKVCVSCVLMQATGLPVRPPHAFTMRPSYRETYISNPEDALSRNSEYHGRPSEFGMTNSAGSNHSLYPRRSSMEFGYDVAPSSTTRTRHSEFSMPRLSIDNYSNGRRPSPLGTRPSESSSHSHPMQGRPSGGARMRMLPPSLMHSSSSPYATTGAPAGYGDSPLSHDHEYGYPLDYNWRHPWPKPPTLPNDTERLDVLRTYGILDTPANEPSWIALAEAAAAAYACPIAAVAFMDAKRLWFKASVGLLQEEIPRDVSFCAHAIRRADGPLVVLDTLDDRRFEQNPLVTGRATIRFYASAPICSPRGHALGTVFVLDTAPRPFCDPSSLTMLARDVEARLVVVPRPLRHYTTRSMPLPSTPVQKDVAADENATRGSDMELMLVDLLRRTMETQHQLSTTQHRQSLLSHQSSTLSA